MLKRLAIAGIAAAACSAGCTSAPLSRAEPVINRDQLIGGPDALGDVGDFKISNGKVRFIIQGMNHGTGFSRGWAFFSGNVLDADLQRPSGVFTGQAKGNDLFGELFPAFFLEALAPTSVEVGNTGADGNPATIIVKGSGQPFVTLGRALLGEAGLDFTGMNMPGLTLTNTFSLGPNDQFLTITTSIGPPPGSTSPLTISMFDSLLAVPMGNVVLFGNQNNPFIPGIGYDTYYGIQDTYANPSALPVGLGGVTTDLIATSGPGVSYGVAIQPPDKSALETSYVANNFDAFKPTPATPAEQQMLVPFVATSFMGVFSAQAPAEIQPGAPFSYTTYLLVGQGDVGSVRDVYYGMRGTQTGSFSARVLEETTHNPITTASVVVLKNNAPFAQYQVNAQGYAIGTLEPGDYGAIVVMDNRARFAPVPFTIVAGQSTQVGGPPPNGGVLPDGITNPSEYILGGDNTMPHALAVPRNSVLDVRVIEGPGPQAGRPLPAKVTLVGTAPSNAAWNGQPPRNYLYDLEVGDRMRPSTATTYDANNPLTRQYVERVVFSDATGNASAQVYPGTYEVIVSRGPEYDTVDLGSVTFAPGQVVTMGAVLNHVVDTTGYISADFHLHSDDSIDGAIDLNTRVLQCAAEGLESATATDHNFITDYTPNILADNLQNYIRGEIGIELTTLELGHFNAFPLVPDPASVTYGAFLWNNMPPDEMWSILRNPRDSANPQGLGDPTGMTVVEMNHARDGTLGYFNDFNVDQDQGVPIPAETYSVLGGGTLSANGPAFTTPEGVSTLSWNFDAMEVYNAKRRELVRTFRVPNPPPPIPAGLNIPSDWPAGAIVRAPCAMANCTDADYAKDAVSSPGEVEDWFGILNEGGKDPSTFNPPGSLNPPLKSQTILPVTATGNSDTHAIYFAEAGYPRNFLHVGKDDPREVSNSDISSAVLDHKVVVSNGPFILMSASAQSGATADIGDLLEVGATDTSFNLNLKVSAAPWLDVQQISIYTNISGNIANDRTLEGQPLIVLPANGMPVACPLVPGAPTPFVQDRAVVRFDRTVQVPITAGKDGWVVVIAEGCESMFPIVTPEEQPPLFISDALATITGPLGLGSVKLGAYAPSLVNWQVPFAITNPIWIDADGDHTSFGRDDKHVKFTSTGRQRL